MLLRLQPLLGIYSDLVRYYLVASLAAHRATGKLLSVLASIFTELAQKVPQTRRTEGESRAVGAAAGVGSH